MHFNPWFICNKPFHWLRNFGSFAANPFIGCAISKFFSSPKYYVFINFTSQTRAVWGERIKSGFALTNEEMCMSSYNGTYNSPILSFIKLKYKMTPLASNQSFPQIQFLFRLETTTKWCLKSFFPNWEVVFATPTASKALDVADCNNNNNEEL